MGQFRNLQAVDGHEFAAFESLPDGEARAGVVVIQEVFGVNPHIRSVADGYASEGYAVIAPAIFDRVERGVELGYDEAGMGAGIKLAFQDLKMENTLKDLQAAIEHVSSRAPNGKVAVVGYCFGGLLTWLSACELDGVTCASSYYGGGVAGMREKQPRCPVMMHFGELDAHIPLSDVEAVRTAQPGVQVFVYEGADHGFNCDARGSFDADSAALARKRTLDFFSEHAA
ncbi:MAG: dienelactone hydrolase family protein [Gammaproteobacteria bacterium]|nr:dienelactone hydrolase family protein [Gammaproteobacteria bacterium]